MSKKLFLYLFGLVVLFSSEFSQAKRDQWSWYYTSFLSNNSNKIFNRYGWSEVTISDGKISGYLVESRTPDIKIPLNGFISGDEVTVELPTFFPSHVIEFSGKLRSETYEGCKYEEISLQYELPNGEIMVMSKTTGECP